jgi:hypothetical protein
MRDKYILLLLNFLYYSVWEFLIFRVPVLSNNFSVYQIQDQPIHFSTSFVRKSKNCRGAKVYYPANHRARASGAKTPLDSPGAKVVNSNSGKSAGQTGTLIPQDLPSVSVQPRPSQASRSTQIHSLEKTIWHDTQRPSRRQ